MENPIEVYSYGLYVTRYTKDRYKSERLELLKLISGELLPKVDTWPADMRKLFWSRPLTDVGTFKLCLFLTGKHKQMQKADCIFV